MQKADWFTEIGWQASENPHHLYAILERRGIASLRKLRLASVACCLALSGDHNCILNSLIEVSERYADGQTAYKDMHEAAGRVRALCDPGATVDSRDYFVARAVAGCGHRQARAGFQDAILCLLGCSWGGPNLPGHQGEFKIAVDEKARTCCRVIRDILGNPFRPVSVDPAWLTWHERTVPKLAQTIYDGRRYDLMPILADALEEAGCTSADILDHCREPGPHVRGCWVLDLMLGKE
jgi:hypothetical protein